MHTPSYIHHKNNLSWYFGDNVIADTIIPPRDVAVESVRLQLKCLLLNVCTLGPSKDAIKLKSD